MRAWIPATILTPAATPLFAHSGAAPAAGKEEPKGPPFRLERLTDRAYGLQGRGGNAGFLVTDAGVVVVNDQFEDVAPGIVDRIRSVTTQPIRHLMNTHYHGDPTGGNPVFAKFAEIVAHENVRTRLLEYPETIRKTFPGKKERLQSEIDANLR